MRFVSTKRRRRGQWKLSLRSKRFLCGLGAKNEERQSKTSRQMAQVKEREGGGEERKEINMRVTYHT